MTNLAACEETYAKDKCHYYSWLEDYLKRLEGKKTYTEFQERCCDTPEYYALVASSAA